MDSSHQDPRAFRDGVSYRVVNQDFTDALKRCARACEKYNHLPVSASLEQKTEAWHGIVAPVIPFQDPARPIPHIKAPVHIDYGLRVYVDPTAFINRGCIILDTPVADVRIGKGCAIGPNVGIYSVSHNLRPDGQGPRISMGKPVTIGDHVWIGGGATILPGVEIGSGTTIAAGSVVRSDVPSNCIAAGVPAKVIRKIRPDEKWEAMHVDSIHEALQVPYNHGGAQHMDDVTRERVEEFLSDASRFRQTLGHI
ncbi:putative acetyltransferase [Colletotrichum chlorophyti]|uniref:Putative acetyltransferase n=1 Tax=Colletotrichum chlorophyti TaxID=708187 RepID=A0A1Q8RBV5_9PEZI|nr:putative acetyltransferase [Colletotrichum chlorophyti]